MRNLHLIQGQPKWRVAVIAIMAKLLGILIHVEGLPFGSSRLRVVQWTSDDSGRVSSISTLP